MTKSVEAVAAAVPDLVGVRRVITTHAGDRSTVLSDEVSPHLRELRAFPTIRFTDLWIAKGAPAPVDGDEDAADGPVMHAPPAGGNIFRLVEIAPDPEGFDPRTTFHATPTVDYVYVLSGEICCLLDDGEVTLAPGDVLIQRATNHAWSNRGDVPCILLGVVVDAAQKVRQ